VPSTTGNNADAIDALIAWFNESPGYQNSYYYKYLHGNWPSGATEADRISVAMRLLIHYVGDAHQPLHNEELVDS